jgi:hypothetical protein
VHLQPVLPQPDDDPVGHDLQPGAVLGRQRAGGADRAHRPAGEPQHRRRRGVDRAALDRPGAQRHDLLDLADQHPGGVEHVHRLLDQRPAGAVPVGPPRHRRHLVHPPGVDRAHRPPGQQVPGRGQVLGAAPVVAHPGQHPRPGQLGVDPLGRGQLGGHRLLHEHRQARRGHHPLGLAVRERRHAHVDGVEALLDERGGVRHRPHAVLLGELRAARGVDVGGRDQPHVVEPRQHGRVA